MRLKGSGKDGVALLAGMLMASPALAHGQGLFTVIVLPPLAVIMYFVAASIARCLFQRTPGNYYWSVVVLCLAFWLPGSVLLSPAMRDVFQISEAQSVAAVALLPVGIALLARLWRRRKRFAK